MRWAWLLVVAAACGGEKKKRDDAAVVAEVHHPVTHLDAPPVALPRLDSITLDAPGAEPRAPLRYALAGTGEQRFRSELRVREDGRVGSAAWHPVEVTLGFGITAAPRGVGLRVLPPEGSADFVASWKSLADRRLTAAVDDRGRLGAIAFADDPAARGRELDDVSQRLLAFTVPLPAEPVGIGATWTAVWILRNIAVQKQTATYTLTARDGRWHVDVELQRVGEAQRLPDAAVEVVALTRHYKGSLVVDPAHLLPVDGTLAADSITHLRDAHGDDILEETGTVRFMAK